MAQLVLQPDASTGEDTYVHSLVSGTNFGTDTIMRAGTDSFGKGSVGYCRSLLRFDLGALPPGATIDAATLTLTPGNSDMAGGGTFYLYRVTRADWTHLGATWLTYDGENEWVTHGCDYTTSGGLSTTIAGPTDNLAFTLLDGLVADALASRAGLLNLIVIGPESGTVDNYYEAMTSKSATPSARPKLVVDYTPPPVLTVADHGDNTGATAAVSQSLPDAINVVYVQNFAGDLGGGDWQNAGAVTGDGNVELDLAAGHYFGYVASLDGDVTTVSGVVYFVVTDGLESLHARCLSAAQARICSLALSGVSNERVVIQKLPLDRNLTGSGGIGLPAIVLSPRRAAMPPTAGTNGFDDVHYDVLVAIFDRDNQEPTLAANLDRHLLWREQIARAFRNQRLTGVPQVINAEVEPAEGLLEEAWKHELMVSALLLRFTSRESRGFN